MGMSAIYKAGPFFKKKKKNHFSWFTRLKGAKDFEIATLAGSCEINYNVQQTVTAPIKVYPLHKCAWQDYGKDL